MSSVYRNNVIAVVQQGLKGAPPTPTERYIHTQSSPAMVWTINHNFGYQPASVTIKSTGGVQVQAQIIHTTVNQTQIYFNTDFAGTAIII